MDARAAAFGEAPAMRGRRVGPRARVAIVFRALAAASVGGGCLWFVRVAEGGARARRSVFREATPRPAGRAPRRHRHGLDGGGSGDYWKAY